ncbi:probable glutamate receptor [Homarus americanus]|uniref:probable glutamate receptor n=1 Tax=Homarus americanus TaxID=6706 RepID=UPI001C49308B|nr:probable glutamate receptor [Homarus americanus]
MLSRVTKWINSYVAVINGARIMDRFRRGQSESHITNTSITTNKILPCGDGLIVLRLQTQVDAYLFREMFPVVSVNVNWLLVTNTSRMPQWLASLYLPLNSRVTIASFSEGNPAAVTLLQAYQVSSVSRLHLDPSGSWSLISAVTTGSDPQNEKAYSSSPYSHDDAVWSTFKSSLPSPEDVGVYTLRFGRLEMLDGDPLLRRDDLTGLHLRCTTISSVPRTILTPAPGGTVTVSGILGNAFHYLKEITNFTSTCKATRDGQWGAKVDGKWTGMISDIVNGDADIALASLDITEQRSSAVDFLMVVVRTEYKMVIKRPTNDDRMWSTFTAEFQMEAWVVLALFLVVLSLTLHLASYSRHQRVLSLVDSITIVFGGICGQGSSVDFRGLPSRAVFLTVMTLQVLIMAHYTSQLVSSMAVGPPLPTISTIGDVSRHPTLKMGLIRGSSLTEYFRVSKSLEHRTIWKSLGSDDFVNSREEGMERVLQQPFVFLAAGAYLSNKYGRDCRYFILPKANFPSISAFAIKKASPLIPVLNKIILRMKTTGLMKKWHSEWTPSPAECNEVEFSPVDLSVVVMAFIFLGAGAAFSVFCLITENIVKKIKVKYSVTHSNLNVSKLMRKRN